MRPIEQIAARIFLVREQRVMLDADLARLYGVETRRLNEQVRRNSFAFRVNSHFSFRIRNLLV